MLEGTIYRIVNICYTNHKGETKFRTIRPIIIFFGANEYHPEEQWLLEAIDMDTPGRIVKTFAMKDIHYWEAPK